MPNANMKEKLIIGILHNHGGELSSTIGVIEVDSVEREDKVAEGHIEFWLAAKKWKHGCMRHGHRCSVDVRPATAGLKTMMLLASAEPIVPGPANSTT